MSISTHSLTRRLTEADGNAAERGTISTHSLTRRLTKNAYNSVFCRSISTHSLTRRLTVGESPGEEKSYFNSQPHKEADD